MEDSVVSKVLGDEKPLDPSIAPGSLVTTTYAEVEEEIGELATCEEDVLMYALFPNEARTYLEKHRKAPAVNFRMDEAVKSTKEEDYVDIAQIRELVKMVEEAGIGEITVEEAGTKIVVRNPNMPAAAAPVAAAAAQPAATPAPTAAPASERPAGWKAVKAYGRHVLRCARTWRRPLRQGRRQGLCR